MKSSRSKNNSQSNSKAKSNKNSDSTERKDTTDLCNRATDKASEVRSCNKVTNSDY